MKLLVFSDSHGKLAPMRLAVEQHAPDAVIHLGDGMAEAEKLRALFPALPVELVPGNCDLSHGRPAERLLFYEESRILIGHGHTWGVKTTLLRARLAAQEQGAQLLLFGHTHRACIDFVDKLWIMNPGSIGDWRAPSYGLLQLCGKRIEPSLLRL